MSSLGERAVVGHLGTSTLLLLDNSHFRPNKGYMSKIERS
jgi:hypothetical protein